MEGPLERTARWVNEVVLGLGLCPFAREPMDEGRVRMVLDDRAAETKWLETQGIEAKRLLAEEPAVLETTLMIFPHAPADFLGFLDLVSRHEAALVDAGHEGVFQLVAFHPEYQFGDAPPNDRAHATNRSPYPTLQLLREASVTHAIDAHPDPSAIWRRNQRVLRALSDEEIEALASR